MAQLCKDSCKYANRTTCRMGIRKV